MRSRNEGDQARIPIVTGGFRQGNDRILSKITNDTYDAWDDDYYIFPDNIDRRNMFVYRTDQGVYRYYNKISLLQKT